MQNIHSFRPLDLAAAGLEFVLQVKEESPARLCAIR